MTRGEWLRAFGWLALGFLCLALAELRHRRANRRRRYILKSKVGL